MERLKKTTDLIKMCFSANKVLEMGRKKIPREEAPPALWALGANDSYGTGAPEKTI